MDLEAYADVLPWVVFVMVDRRAGLGISWAGGCAAVTGAGLIAWGCMRGRRVVIAAVGTCLFTSLCIAGFWVGHPGATVDEVCRVAAPGVLALIAFASLAWRPLSEDYTETRVVPAVSAGERFSRLNQEVTAAWGLGALAVTGSYVLAMANKSAVVLTFLNWVLPLAIGAATAAWVHRRWERFRVDAERVDADTGPDVAFPALGLAHDAKVVGRRAVVNHLRVVEMERR